MHSIGCCCLMIFKTNYSNSSVVLVQLIKAPPARETQIRFSVEWFHCISVGWVNWVAVSIQWVTVVEDCGKSPSCVMLNVSWHHGKGTRLYKDLPIKPLKGEMTSMHSTGKFQPLLVHTWISSIGVSQSIIGMPLTWVIFSCFEPSRWAMATTPTEFRWTWVSDWLPLLPRRSVRSDPCSRITSLESHAVMLSLIAQCSPANQQHSLLQQQKAEEQQARRTSMNGRWA